jgi:hypothetical protein
MDGWMDGWMCHFCALDYAHVLTDDVMHRTPILNNFFLYKLIN